MAAMYAGEMSVSEVAKVFVMQYYQIIQQSPHVGYQFYSDASTVLRIDGNREESAVSTMKIHTLLSQLNFTAIEIKTVQSLASWAGGVLVMVTGSVKMKDYNGRREFVQTFFLAPQEKGYFVLNDIFQLLDEETTFQPSATILGHDNYGSSSNVANLHIQDPVLGYTIGEEIQTRDYASPVNVLEEELQAREYVAPRHADEIDTVDKYSIPEPQYSVTEPQYDITEPEYSMSEPEYSMPEPQYSIPQPEQVSEPDEKLNEIPVEESVASFPTSVTMVRDPPPSSTGEHLGERPKLTYASILRQPGNPMPRAAPASKTTPVVSDAQLATSHQSHPATSVQPENFSSETAEDVTTAEDEGEVKSVYVGNLSSSVSAADLEYEFKNFGRIKPNGVTVRSRKDSGGFYAFVEFEDAASVQTALQASPIVVNGRQIYVEERKPNSGISRPGGGRRGRGRGGYQSDAPRGRFGGRGFSRSGGNDNDREYNSGRPRGNDNDREYNSGRARGNGVLPRVPRQERGILGSHAMRNGQNPSEAAY